MKAVLGLPEHISYYYYYYYGSDMKTVLWLRCDSSIIINDIGITAVPRVHCNEQYCYNNIITVIIEAL